MLERLIKKGKTTLEKILICTGSDDMNYEALADRARYYKKNEKGVAAMCKIM